MEQRPKDRPTAAALVRIIKSFEDRAERTDTQPYIGTCCLGAVSNTVREHHEPDIEPALPESHESECSRMETQNAVVAEQSANHDPDRPVETMQDNDSPPSSGKTHSTVHEPEAPSIMRSPSKTSSVGSSQPCARDSAEASIFTGTLSWHDEVKDCKTAKRTETDKELECSLQVFETLLEQTWRRTRRLELSRSAADNNSSLKTSLWLPLADIKLRSLSENEVLMEWSDCNQIHRYKTGDHGRFEDRVYKRTPNNQIKLRFRDPGDVENFESCMLSLTADPCLVRQKAQVVISTTQRVKIYTVFPTVGPGSVSEYRALLILNRGPEGSISSRLCLAWRDIDFEVCRPSPDNGGMFQLKLYNLRRPDYISGTDTRERRAPEPDLIGTHDETKLLDEPCTVLECPLNDEPFPQGTIANSSSTTSMLILILQGLFRRSPA